MGLVKSVVKSVMPKAAWDWLRPRWNWLRFPKARRHFAQSVKLFDTLKSRGFVSPSDDSILSDYQKISGMIDGEQYYSQMMQDYVLDRFIFQKKEGGFFLDIGGNDPIWINNTFFFEKNRGWKGLAFEPIKALNDKWKSTRKTECLPFALDCVTGEIEFCEYEVDSFSGFTSEVDCGAKVKSVYKVPVRRLADVLAERGIKHVDFVSLDVEGAEMRVLNGIDFSEVTIDYFVIENNKGASREKSVREFMKEHGYRLIARLWIDDIYAKDF